MTLSEHAPGPYLLRCLPGTAQGKIAMVGGGERDLLLLVTPSAMRTVRLGHQRTVDGGRHHVSAHRSLP